jgi:hypothetical protein
VYLHLEDISGDRNPAVGYEVLVQTATAEQGGTAHYVGNVSFFGIEHTRPDGPDTDGPHGMRRTFDITSVVALLRAAGQWDEQRLTVHLRPLELIPAPGGVEAEAEPEGAAGAAGEPPEPVPTVRIGRVSLSYE